MAKITFIPDLAFGQLELREPDSSIGRAIPSWLINQPDVLKALMILSEQGGTKGRAFQSNDFYDLLVDTEARTVTQVPEGC